MKKVFILSILTLSAASLSAQVFSASASFAETIEASGPTGSPFFHNAQGPGSFEEYGISSFSVSASDFGLTTVTGISAMSISYVQNNPFFSSDGGVEFFVSFDATVGGGDYAGLTHGSTSVGVVDSQFSDSPSAQSLGTGTFTQTSSGDVDTYTLDFAALESDFLSSINSGTPFSIMITAPDGDTAATYSGIGNTDFPGDPMLSITAVPEPSTYALLLGALGLGFVVWRRRR